MGERYATILVGGVVATYNDDPPTDDGSQTEANRVKYSTVTGDLSSPLHSAITRMDAKLLTQTDEGPDLESSTATLTVADHNTVLEASGTITLSLPNPSGNAGFQCTIKNAGSGVVTVDVDGGANVDGSASLVLAAGFAKKFYVNNAGTAYFSVAGSDDGFPSGTVMLFEGAAPTGWVKKTDSAYDNVSLRVITGTVTDLTYGSVDFDTVFGLTATDGVTLSAAQSGTTAHTHPSHRHRVLEDMTGAGGARTTIAVDTDGTGDTTVYIDTNESSDPYIEGTVTPASAEAAADDPHVHGMDLQVRYRDVIAAEKT